MSVRIKCVLWEIDGENINALFVEKQEAIVYNKKLALCACIRARTKNKK